MSETELTELGYDYDLVDELQERPLAPSGGQCGQLGAGVKGCALARYARALRVTSAPIRLF